MQLQVLEIVDISKTYCKLIETASESCTDWLKQVSLLLPRLHAAVSDLNEVADCCEHELMGDLEQRFDLFVRLRTLIGARDSYWMEYDSCTDMGAMSGSLADDLTDIYFELNQVLQCLEEGEVSQKKAADDWRNGFHAHWGQHLLDAERHLYLLGTRNQLDGGAPHSHGLL